VFDKLPLPQIMLGLSLIAMFGASLIAVFQENLKRLFAYSSVGQMGYITLGLSFDSVNGVTASIVHLFNHGIAKGAIFLLIGGIVAAAALRGTVAPAPTFANLAGLSKRMPLTSFGIVIGGLSLIGVPGTAGFISKWYLILAALEKDQWWLVGRDPAEFPAGSRLRLALCRGGVFPSLVRRGTKRSARRRCRCWCRPGCWS